MQGLEDPGPAAALFRKYRDTMVKSCLETTMGKVFADDPSFPQTAAACLGEFCFLAGKADRKFLEELRDKHPQAGILVPNGEGWSEVIEQTYGSQAERISRYAFLKEEHVWDLDYLENLAQSLPKGCYLKQMDEAIYQYAESHEWARDWVSQFPSYEEFAEKSLGIAVIKDGTPVSGAAAYCASRKEIDIQIDTLPEFQRKGLALACGAKLILECEKRGLYPSWDAHNPASAALAQKLGYHMEKEYPAYVVSGSCEKNNGG